MNHRCIRNPRTGGAERTIFEVGKRLVARGHEVDLLTGGWPHAPKHEIIAGIKIHRYGSMLLPHLVQPFYLRYHKDADVIVDDMAHAAPWFSPWLSDKPGVVFFRHMHARTLRGQVSPYLALMLSFFERHYSFIYRSWPFITESDSSENDLNLLGIASERITKIPPGVDTKLFRPSIKTESPSIVYFGGMRPYKRPEHALIALRLLEKRGCKARLTMVGDGPSLPFLKRLSEELGIGDRVSFTGRISDYELSELVASSWVNLHCSMSEGWGLSVLESAAAGTPTIAYDVPGIRETVINGVTGTLVTEGDVTGLSQSIEDVFESQERWTFATREHAAKFSWESTTSRWEEKLSKSILDSVA